MTSSRVLELAVAVKAWIDSLSRFAKAPMAP